MTPRAGCANPLTMADTPQKSEAKDTLRFFLKLALFVFILRSFIVTSFVIPSESMLPRLLIVLHDLVMVALVPKTLLAMIVGRKEHV